MKKVKINVYGKSEITVSVPSGYHIYAAIAAQSELALRSPKKYRQICIQYSHLFPEKHLRTVQVLSRQYECDSLRKALIDFGAALMQGSSFLTFRDQQLLL